LAGRSWLDIDLLFRCRWEAVHDAEFIELHENGLDPASCRTIIDRFDANSC
jgi:hypothetical protein